MKTILSRIIPIIPSLCLAVASASAEVRYVDVNNASPSPPYTNWATAATNIQDAVDAATSGDRILVTNGVYQSGVTNQSRVAVDKPVTVQSVNGPQLTTIEGGLLIRCVYLANGTFLAGFTLTNGNVFFGGLGGGVAFGNLQSDAIVSNCVIVGCAAGWGGGAASAVSSGGPPGINGGTLLNCTFKGNLANGAPGGFGFPPASGGAADGCKLINCTLTGNTAAGPSVGQGGGASSCVLQSCLLIGNSAVQGPGGGAAYSDLINCTVVSNSASSVGGAYACSLRNSIVYDNSQPNHAADNYVRYTCTTPLADGPGNITNAPLFASAAAGNYRLQAASPCVDAGSNDYVTGPVDLEGKERIVGGPVDIGAYEWVAVPTHYVSLNSPNPTTPYLSWSTAATNIQDAVDVAVAGDHIVVSNGVYQAGGRAMFGTMTNRVAVDKPVAVQSVNGPQFTLIQGYQMPDTINGDSAIRCVYLTNGASLSGFTLTNGATRSAGDPYSEQSGGGLWCHSATAVVSNCVIAGSSAAYDGGGAYQGTLNSCVLTTNTGGGAFQCTLNRCILIGNSAYYGGGAAVSTLNNCTLIFNSASNGGGTSESTLNNCLLVGNYASSTGGGAFYGTLNNCTLAGNRAGTEGGGAYGGTLNNCIIILNYVFGENNYSLCTLNYCCTMPTPTTGCCNISSDPLFLNRTAAGLNLRLQSNSPCINAGNNAFVVGSTDLDGRPRIVSGTVDIGAYEFQPGVSGFFLGWLQQYGLPTDGSADYSDSDTDLMNNWQEWIAGTVPTNALSVLRLLNPINDMSGVIVSWQSVSNRTYFLERATNVGAAQPFSLLTSNIVGQTGTTSYTDTSAIGPGPFFYRVGVQQ